MLDTPSDLGRTVLVAITIELPLRQLGDAWSGVAVAGCEPHSLLIQAMNTVLRVPSDRVTVRNASVVGLCPEAANGRGAVPVGAGHDSETLW